MRFIGVHMDPALVKYASTYSPFLLPAQNEKVGKQYVIREE